MVLEYEFHGEMLTPHSLFPLHQVIAFNLGSLGFLTNHYFRDHRDDIDNVIFGCQKVLRKGFKFIAFLMLLCTLLYTLSGVHKALTPIKLNLSYLFPPSSQ